MVVSPMSANIVVMPFLYVNKQIQRLIFKLLKTITLINFCIILHSVQSWNQNLQNLKC